jgi:hypothetical protein
MSEDWLYRHGERLGLAFKQGGWLRFSALRIQAYIRCRAGR